VGRRRHACVLRERQEPSRPAEAVVEGRLDLRLPPARATVHHGELVEREPHHGTRQGQVWEEIKPSFQSAIAGGVLSPCAAGNRRPPPTASFFDCGSVWLVRRPPTPATRAARSR